MPNQIHFHLEPSRNYFHVRLLRNVNLAAASKLEGFDVTDNGSVGRFARTMYTPQLANLAAYVMLGFEIETDPSAATLDANPNEPSEKGFSALAVSESDLQIINRDHAVKAQTADTIAVFERFVVNDSPARNGIWFTKRALEKFAADYQQGRSRLLHHSRESIVGRTFAADVVKKKIRGISANWVRVREYIPRIPANEETIANIESGVYAFDSIGFSGGEPELVEYKVSEDRTRYFLKIDFNPEGVPVLEAGEVSYVFLGAIYGAGNDKQQAAIEPETTTVEPQTESELWLNYP